MSIDKVFIDVPSFLKRATEKTPCRSVGSLLPAADSLIPALPCREESLDYGAEDLIDHSADKVEDRSVNDEEGGIVHDDSNQLICGVYQLFHNRHRRGEQFLFVHSERSRW